MKSAVFSQFLRTLVTILAAGILGSNAFALPESSHNEIHDLLENRDGFFLSSSFTGTRKKKISYTKFGLDRGEKGCVVISPGQGEPSLKYLELAHDLIQQGYTAVYSIDHRGQGLSDRLTHDHQKGHVDRFKNYVSDFEIFVNDHVLRDPICTRKNLYLLGHSMGGAIAVAYLQTVGGVSPFKKVVLSSPMLKLAMPSGKSEVTVLAETWIACNTIFGPKCDDFIPGKGAFNPKRPFLGNDVTSSRTRFDFYASIRTQWPALQLGGPTVWWVREAVKASRAIRKPKNVARTKVPTLILQASEDTLVDNDGQNAYCKLHRNCRIAEIDGAKHEVLMETDSLRDQALSELLDFLKP